MSTDIVPLLHPSAFFILAFPVIPFFLIVPNEMVKNNVPAMTALVAELAVIASVVLFGFLQLCHRKMSGRRTTALVLGFLMPWILLTPLQEFGTFSPGKNGTGMLAVGMVALIALLLWRGAALRRQRKAFTTTESEAAHSRRSL